MILLETLLAGLQVEVKTFAVCHVAHGTSLALPANDLATVHYSLRGSGTLRLGESAPASFARHSFMVLPPKRRVVIGAHGTPLSEAGSAALANGCEPLAKGLSKLRNSAETPDVVLACGRIDATYRGAKGLFEHLTEPLIDDFAYEDGLCRTFELLLSELADPRPGTIAMADSLMQQCLVLLLRRYCGSGECRLPWLSALEDERLSRVVAALLAHPERSYSLESLAELAGMSRSAFAARFAAAFERTPMEFLKELRLCRAAEMLRNTDLPVKAISARVGYDSRSYFSRAFKTRYGVDPLAYRRRASARIERSSDSKHAVSRASVG